MEVSSLSVISMYWKGAAGSSFRSVQSISIRILSVPQSFHWDQCPPSRDRGSEALWRGDSESSQAGCSLHSLLHNNSGEPPNRRYSHPSTEISLRVFLGSSAFALGSSFLSR